MNEFEAEYESFKRSQELQTQILKEKNKTLEANLQQEKVKKRDYKDKLDQLKMQLDEDLLTANLAGSNISRFEFLKHVNLAGSRYSLTSYNMSPETNKQKYSLRGRQS